MLICLCLKTFMFLSKMELLKNAIFFNDLLGRNILDVIVFIADNNTLISQCFFLQHPLLGQQKTFVELL